MNDKVNYVILQNKKKANNSALALTTVLPLSKILPLLQITKKQNGH